MAVQTATSQYQTASSQAVGTFKTLAKLEPGEPSLFALAQTAQHFRDTKTALAAYKRLLKIEKDPSLKAQIKATIQLLQPSKPKAGG